MEVFKTMVFFDGSGAPEFVDTIWYEGHWWLIATWLEHPATGHRIPERIVQMDGMTVRFDEVKDPAHRFLINNSIPASVYDGKPHTGYVIAIHPLAIPHTREPDSTR